MRTISLTQGRFAFVDDQDFSRVVRFSWHAVKPRGKRKDVWYAKARVAPGKRSFLHRFLLDAPARILVDHEDGDGLNCQRYNLRLVTHAQNKANSRPKLGSTSRFKGVYRPSNRPGWAARIEVDGNKRWLGYFKSEIEAARAYDLAAKDLHGEFARLNLKEAA